jgi:two-component system, response regulator PdtaR
MDANRTILIVDDEAPLRTVLCEYLATRGYHVIESAGASQAFAALSACPDIELVITDIMMPGTENGFELGRRLRVEYPEVKVLFMSGNPAALKLSALSSPTAFMAKPFRLPALMQRVEGLIAPIGA